MPDETQKRIRSKEEFELQKITAPISADVFTHPNKVDAFLEKYM